MNPVGQEHVAEAEQIPEAEHGGEHAEDWIFTRERGRDASGGSWEISGTVSQSITGCDDEAEVKATQTLSESAKELAGSGMEPLIGEEGR